MGTTSIKHARMSKVTNDGLTRSGIGCFMAVPKYGATVMGVKGLSSLCHVIRRLGLLEVHLELLLYHVRLDDIIGRLEGCGGADQVTDGVQLATLNGLVTLYLFHSHLFLQLTTCSLLYHSLHLQQLVTAATCISPTQLTNRCLKIALSFLQPGNTQQRWTTNAWHKPK